MVGNDSGEMGTDELDRFVFDRPRRLLPGRAHTDATDAEGLVAEWMRPQGGR